MTNEELKAIGYTVSMNDRSKALPGELSSGEVAFVITMACCYYLDREKLTDRARIKRIAVRAEMLLKQMRLMEEILHNTLEEHRRLEHLRRDYNKTHSDEAAHAIACAMTEVKP